MQAATRDDVSRSGVFSHVKRILVAHVDDGCADLDLLGARADRGEERKRRAELTSEVMDAVVGAISAKFLGGYSQLDRLQQRVRRRAYQRVGRRRPMAK